MNRGDEQLIAALVMIVCIILLFAGLTYINYIDPPQAVKPGMEVVVLTGETKISDGKPCQVNLHGFISPTSPNKDFKWYKAERWFYPFQYSYTVILDNGNLIWVNHDHVVFNPYDESKLLCGR